VDRQPSSCRHRRRHRYHVATAYVLDIDWYYEERTTHAATEVVVAAAILPASLFAMAVLFLVAGVIAQRSLARKGAWPFILGRLVRLGAPLVIFTLLIGPMTSVLGARAEADPAADDVGSLFVEELHEFDTGPMWFLAALLVFSIAYAAWRNGRSARGTPASDRSPCCRWGCHRHRVLRGAPRLAVNRR
jgi:glucan biosynthesis protein C